MINTVSPGNHMTVAKPVVKNKFWIVEEAGQKTATIQAIEKGGFAFVKENQREVFPTIKLLSKKYNIEFVKAEKATKNDVSAYDIHGFPTPHKPYNVLFDVSKKLPVFTKSKKSKSFFCAGYYIVKFANSWARSYCPKAITLNRYEYQGPFRTQKEMLERLKLANSGI
jgi:hypothetical protein